MLTKLNFLNVDFKFPEILKYTCICVFSKSGNVGSRFGLPGLLNNGGERTKTQLGLVNFNFWNHQEELREKTYSFGKLIKQGTFASQTPYT